MRPKSNGSNISVSGVSYKTPKAKKPTGAQLEEFKNEYTIDDHQITVEELAQRYHTNIKTGLTQVQADQLLQRDGPNCLAAPPVRSKFSILLEFLFCGLAILMWAAAIFSFINYGISYSRGKIGAEDQLYIGVVMILIILITGIFGFYQESANVAIIESFQKLTPKFAYVIRDGKSIVIPSEEVVMGDLVELKAGEWISADIRLIQVQGLKVDNSAITGESMAQSRSAKCTDPMPIETANMVFFSTCVVEGTGKGIVVNRGGNTLIGRIAGLTSSLQKGETPIRREINYFIKFITILSLIIGLTIFIICMSMGYSFFDSFAYFIALVIANVPEGLPVTLTACMTLTSKRMASKNCMVKKLEAIETLGCCNVICSDKTGTLTQNKMKVVHLYYDNQAYYILNDLEALDRETRAFQALCQVAKLCSRATFKEGQEHVPIDKRVVIGDASEEAILKCMEWVVGNVVNRRRDYPKVCEIPFNSTNKYQVSVHKMRDNTFKVMMKGAPERVIEHCSTILQLDENRQLSDEMRKFLKKSINNLGLKGERVLAFADLALPNITYGPNYRFNADEKNFPLTGLRFVGLISMMDPPRPSVPDAVSKCRTAGIRVIMVTGDHPLTAAAIAKQVGILSSTSITSYDIAIRRDVSVSLVTEKEKNMCNAAVITGHDLRDMNEIELQKCLIRYNEIVFARTSPQQKLKIVEAFQKLGRIVAVTGDGVNDSPALKKADIGVAMGISGTDVSKDAADMVLLDDNFSSIVTGIEEGRLIFDNLKKSIAYLLTSNVPEIIPFVMMIVVNFPPILSVLAVMVIDVGTDLMPAISLAYEKAEADIMLRLPRDPQYDKLVNHRLIFLTYGQIGVIQTCAGFTSYFILLLQYGFKWHDLPGLRTKWVGEGVMKDSFSQEWTSAERRLLTKKCYSAFFLSIVFTQVADLLICKTRRLSLFQQGMTNWVLNAGIFIEVAIAGIAVFCPGIRTVLQFEPIGLEVIIPTIPFAIIIVAYDEVRKYFIRKYPHGLVDKETYY